MPRALWLCAFLLASVAYADSKGSSSVGDSDEAALIRLRKDIIDMIGEPVCTNLVYCRILALGVRPCGKPDEYLAYSSTAKTNEEKLSVKASEYAFIQEEIQMSAKTSGICNVPATPRVQCVDQRCKLQP